ncbi:MAG: hypothetical protein EA369_06850 [Bradymonadales bacterium]|nr:MAG: hypothetical protein EA369_06850 [Bradymonadales bacterium]
MTEQKESRKEMKTEKLISLGLVCLAVALSFAFSFLIDAPANFSILGASLLVLAVFIRHLPWLLFLSLLLIVANLLQGPSFPGMGWHLMSFGVYLAIGRWWKRDFGWTRSISSPVLASLCFFVVSNLGVWLWSPLYEVSLSGLVLCFTMAIPFGLKSLLADCFFTACFIGLSAWAHQRLSDESFSEKISLQTQPIEL